MTPVLPTGVRFNEVAPWELYDWSLSGTVSAADRYFELINWSAAPADISGYTVDNGYAVFYTFPPGTTIGPYSRKVFLAEDTLPIYANGDLTLYDRNDAFVTWVVYYGNPGPGYCYQAQPDGSSLFAWTPPEACSPGLPNP